MSLNFKIVCLDLRKYSTKEDLEKIFQDNLIEGLYIDKILELREKYQKVYIDTSTNELFAVLQKNGEIMLSQSTDTHLFNMKSLKPKTTNLSSDFSDLDIDEILDKINQQGIDSLSAREKYFLKKKS